MRTIGALAIGLTVLALVGCGGKTGTSSAVGVYHLVKDQALKDSVLGVAQHDTPGANEEMVAQMTKMIDEMEMDLTVKADGTFEVTGKLGGKFHASGTWKLEGRDLTITATHQDGEKREEPEVTKMIYEGDTIRMPKDEKSTPFEMVLRRE